MKFKKEMKNAIFECIYREVFDALTLAEILIEHSPNISFYKSSPITLLLSF